MSEFKFKLHALQALWPWPSSRIMLGYAFILTHPGIPCVFYDHMFGWGLHDQISQLVGGQGFLG